MQHHNAEYTLFYVNTISFISTFDLYSFLFIREMLDNDRFLCCYILVVCECSVMSLCSLIGEARTYNSQSCTVVAFDNSGVEFSFTATRMFVGYILTCTFLICPLCLQEFLKKEFSHENIYFWVACEKYRSLSSPAERAASARDIFERHLCLGALEPVNVDSHARQATQDGLTDAASTLFLQAQKQIFNLMKFDSYPRFLKSDLYKECVVRELSGQALPFPGGEGLDTGLQLHGTGESHRNNKVQPHSIYFNLLNLAGYVMQQQV